MSGFDIFLAIRGFYAQVLPEWLADYEATGRMAHDPYLMDWQFTPIEANVWADIRYLGLPFYPQLPVLNYFLDFGNPFLKIGIECDGKAWHNKDLDRARDARLAADGWMIFRLEGHECKREVDTVEFGEPYDPECEKDDWRAMEQFYGTTSEGVLRAIKQTYFDDSPPPRNQFFISATLFEHRTTPETSPVRRPLAPSKPTRFVDLMPEYLALIQQRTDRAAA